MSTRVSEGYQHIAGRTLRSLLIAGIRANSNGFGSDSFSSFEPTTLEAELEKRRSDLRSGLTDRQRLFLFGKLGGLNDKDAALAAGYSVSVAENTKQRIWKPLVLAEYERVCQALSANTESKKPGVS
jgi:hypothetical protein